ncbi:hypothetical protein [Demequina sp.]|uniref:hypothetical protein n=1 Tax=Demequina sp. TaxID=2050685 RepID=UPI003D0B246A
MAYFAESADVAEAQGATAEQVEVLRAAARTGELTSAQVTPLLGPYFECLADHGMRGEFDGTMEVGPDVELPQVVVAYIDLPMNTDEEIQSAIELQRACEDTYVGYAWKAIQLAPTTVEAWDADFAARTPAILACIRDHGGSIDEDAAVSEIVEAAVAVAETTGERCMTAG